jgi:hypothetical protein
MKVYLSGYRSHWISPYRIMEKIIFWREIDYEEPFIEKCNKVLTPFCNAWMKLLDFIHPKIEYVKIDRYDTWSMDHTLAHIILPMLKQLRDESHGSPWVDDEDVPAELRSPKKRTKKSRHNNPDIQMLESNEDDLIHKRWAWVLDEMIWAFEQKMLDDAESQFFDYSGTDGKKMPWHGDYVAPKVDWDGLNAHNERKRNAFRLFGRYYENLWD